MSQLRLLLGRNKYGGSHVGHQEQRSGGSVLNMVVCVTVPLGTFWLKLNSSLK